MIDTRMLSVSELTNIVLRVQKRTGYVFEVQDIYDIASLTIRKAALNGQNEVYVPILLENELEDFVMRERINRKWRTESCARSACIAPA